MAGQTAIDRAIDEAARAARFWWAEPAGERVANAVTGTIDALRTAQKYRQDDNLMHLRLYGNAEYRSLQAEGYLQVPRDPLSDRLKYNLCASVTDTICAKVFKNKPRPMFLTDGGDYAQQRRAQALSKFELGIFYENETYRLIQEHICKDAAVMGTGFLMPYRGRDDRVKHERIFPDEIVIDDGEARWGEPRNAFRVKGVHRELLIAEFGGKEERDAIARAPALDPSQPQSGRNMILVCEAWHLPDPYTMQGGRHVIAIKGHALLDEPWRRPGFPWAALRWYPRLLGYFGQGTVERLRPLQVEINKLLMKIQEILHYHAHPAWWVPRGARFNKEALGNDLRNVYVYDGNVAPTLVTPAPVPPELYVQVDRLIQKGYDQEGVSTISSTGKNPLGPNASGAALETFNDIESERMVLLGQAYENFVLEISRLDQEVMRQIDEHPAPRPALGPSQGAVQDGAQGAVQSSGQRPGQAREAQGYRVAVTEKSRVQQIQWSDVKLDQGQYVLKAFPVSSLPQTPAGRIQYIEYLRANGYLGLDEAMDLMGFPDIDASNSLNLASLEIVKWIVAGILERGEYVAPEPEMDLPYSLKRMQLAYLRAKQDGAPQERLDLMLEWMAACKDEMARQQAAGVQYDTYSAYLERPPVKQRRPAPGPAPAAGLPAAPAQLPLPLPALVPGAPLGGPQPAAAPGLQPRGNGSGAMAG